MSEAVAEVPAAPVLTREDDGAVAYLTLNRPEQFNALSEAMLAGLQENLDALAEDDQIQVVVLRAHGRAFCAGHDLKEMRRRPEQSYYRALFNRCARMMQTVQALPQPVIAQVQGIATAAGCQLVATCDLAVASDTARFAVSGVNLGLFCSTPAVALSRNLAAKPALEMLLTGEFVDAPRARELGLVNRVVPGSELAAATTALANTIAAKPAVAVRTGKALFYKQLRMDLADAYLEAGEAMACNMMAEDTVEGVDAFIEKRRPRWAKD